MRPSVKAVSVNVVVPLLHVGPLLVRVPSTALRVGAW